MDVSRLRSRTGRRGLIAVLGVVTIIAGFALPSLGLSGSTFEGADGNLAVDSAGLTDWANVAGLNAGVDNPSGSKDNSFGQGTKEDNSDVTVVSGSIPPNKSDLTRFYEASETVGGDTFLYLAWERTNVLGTANMDFEINQVVTDGLGDQGKHTINRSPGDLLVTYDFTNGGTKPILGLNTWLTSASVPAVPGFSTNVCLSSNRFPCWGDHIDLNSSDSEGAINTITVTDPIAPDAPRDLPALTFGEASINLTDAGVFQPGICKAFGSAFLKSRASTSFPAEVKDFVAPVPVNISNCGTLVIKKVTDPSPDPSDMSFAFTVNGPDTNLPKTFNLKDGQSNRTQVFAGTTFSAEETVPDWWTLTDASCDNGSGTLSGSKISDISVAGDETVTCTFYDKRKRGALTILKKSTKTGNPLVSNAGAVFSYSLGIDPTTTRVTDNGNGDQDPAVGSVCVADVFTGAYTVNEISPPRGYGLADGSQANQSVHVVAGTNCSTNLPAESATAVFTDPPLSDIQVNFRDGGSGETSAMIDCDNTTGTSSSTVPSGWDESKTVKDVTAPTVVNCTIAIDP